MFERAHPNGSSLRGSSTGVAQFEKLVDDDFPHSLQSLNAIVTRCHLDLHAKSVQRFFSAASEVANGGPLEEPPGGAGVVGGQWCTLVLRAAWYRRKHVFAETELVGI